MIKKPMLASTAPKSDNDYEILEKMLPYLVSVKLDGIRIMTHPVHGPCTRVFKDIPNDHIRETLRDECPEYLDGEVMTYSDSGVQRTFNEIQGDVMRKSGKPDFRFHVFDTFLTPEQGFQYRYNQLWNLEYAEEMPTFVHIVTHTEINSMAEINAFAEQALKDGYEGAMLRSLDGKYKQGRSTLRQGWLVKIKFFSDAEGTVIGFDERTHNANEAKKNKIGKTDRPTNKENMIPMNTLGSLVLDTEWGELRVGTGFDDITRQGIWNDRKKYMGATVTFTYQPSGAKTLPRFPVFKGFRKEFD
jgi:DNA ligase-1